MVYPEIRDEPKTLNYDIPDGENVHEAISNAFASLGLDVYEKDTTIEDWTKDCPVDVQDWESSTNCRVTTTIWNHPVVLTANRLRIYVER